MARPVTCRQRATPLGMPATTARSGPTRQHQVPATHAAVPGSGTESATATSSTCVSRGSGPSIDIRLHPERSTRPAALAQTAISAATDP